MNKIEAVVYVLKNSLEIRERHEREHGLNTEKFIASLEQDSKSTDTLSPDSPEGTMNSIIEDGLEIGIIGEEVIDTKYFVIL